MIRELVNLGLFRCLFISYDVCVYLVMHIIGSSQLVEVPTFTDFSISYHCNMILDYAEVALHFR